MRKIRIIEHMSLDGVVQGPGSVDEDPDGGFDRGGWIVPHGDPAIREAITQTHGQNFDLILGRRTYDIWSGYWPTAPDNALSRSLNGAVKHVATSRPESLEWGPVHALGPDVAGDIMRLKAGDGPDLILWGSSSLPALLLEHGLADEIVLLVYPVLLGSGKRIFTGAAPPARLALQQATVTASGVSINRYLPLAL